MVQEATDICLRVLKESNKSRFDSFSRYEQCIDHIPYYLSGLSGAHFFRQPFSKQLYIVYRFCSIAFYNCDYNGDLSPPKRHVFITPVFAFK